MSPLENGPWLTLNLAGEGEVPTAIDINNLIQPRRDPERWMRSGRFILGDIVELPVRDGCAHTIVGNRLPMMTDDDRAAIGREAFRVLQPGGQVGLHSTSGGGHIWVPALTAAGFDSTTIEGDHVKAVKP